jgi:hypothetical protein
MQLSISRLSRWGILPALLLAVLATPFSGVTRAATHTSSASSAPINTIVYFPLNSLQPLFRQQINQHVPAAFNSSISTMVNKLPAEDRGWATQMASALLQPSATLTSLQTQPGGLAATIRISLYDGDPKPTTTSLLVTMTMLDAATVQVSAQPLPGNPSIVSGPLTTLQIPFGQLNSINTTPTCGESALGVHLQVPMALAQAPTQGQQIALRSQHLSLPQADQAAMPAYLEIPATSLATLGSGIGTLSLGNNTTARNIQIAVQGSQLVATSDIMLGSSSIVLGKATSYIQPVASQGKLTVHVLKTTMTVFSLFTFPDNTYNQQIEQSLNTKLGNALAGKFYVNNAAIGSNTHVPCAAADSLILTGTTSLG